MKLPLLIATLWGTWAVEAQASQPVVPATTEVIWTTKLQTVVKCPDGVTNCLSSGTAVVTSVMEATTTYCPVVDTPPGYVDGTTMSSDHSSTASSIPSSNVPGASSTAASVPAGNVPGASSTAASVPSGTTASNPSGNATWMSPLPAPSSEANGRDSHSLPTFQDITDFVSAVAHGVRAVAYGVLAFAKWLGLVVELIWDVNWYLWSELYYDLKQLAWWQWALMIHLFFLGFFVFRRYMHRQAERWDRRQRQEQRKKELEKRKQREEELKQRKIARGEPPKLTKAESRQDMHRIMRRVNYPYYPETGPEYFARHQGRSRWQMSRPQYREALANDTIDWSTLE